MDAEQQTLDDRKQLAVRALTRADRFLLAVAQEIPGIAQRLRRGEIAEVKLHLEHLLDGLGSLARLAIDIERLEESLGRTRPEGFDLGQMARALRDFVHAQEARDWPGSAEVLETRIAPQVPRWRHLFHVRLSSLQSAPSTG
ncbi:MAG: hypothetical protein JSV80_15675 [Acidobacteriota bacterium]|nr:MAG: hypothetical protein JSV80_15675 [Acidobacteriota bacterium]